MGGFRCVGLSESEPNQENSDTSGSGVPPNGWNRNFDVYSFKYKHSQSSMNFLLKCVTLGDRLLVHALAIEDKQPHGLELIVSDYVDKDKLNNVADVELVDLFKQLDKLETLFKINISAKLVPFMNKDGYEANSTAASTSFPYNSSSSSATSSSSSEDNRNNGTPSRRDPEEIPDTGDDPLRIGPPRQPRSRLIEDPYAYGRNPYSIGDQDLYPDLGMPFGGPRLPFHPGTGSVVGPHHPMFGSGNIYNPPRHGPPTNLPRGVPPRARFDPYGPPGTGSSVPDPNPDHLRRPRFNDDDENPFFF